MGVLTGFWRRLVIGAISPTGVGLVLGAWLGVATPGPSTAQTFDQAILDALRGPEGLIQHCAALTAPLAALTDCFASGGTAASAGLVTVNTRPGASEEERAVQRRLQAKRDEERRGGAPGASPDLPRGLGLFVSGEYERFDKDLTTFEPAYDSNTYGLTVGVDYTFTPWLVTGLAFNYNRIDGEFDLGGDFSTDSYGGLLYASVRPISNLFVDLVGGYARKDFSVDRRVTAVDEDTPGVATSDTMESDTNGDEFTAGVLAGYDFVIRSVTIGPRVGLNYRHLSIDGFQESGSGTTGLELAYKSQDQESLTSRVGLYGSMAISTRIGVFIPQASFDYIHEFLDDQRSIRFHFVGDADQTQFRFENDPPDRNYFHVGAGLVVALPGGFYPFVNYRALLGYKDQSSHVVTAGLRFAF